MRYALDSKQMRAAEHAAVASGSVTIETLMDRAGHALADEVGCRVPEGPVAVVCGPGNNGGDGWVAARVLANRGREVCVIALRRPESLEAEAREAALAAANAAVHWTDGAHVADAVECLAHAAVTIDAIFGFGLHGVVREPYAAWIRRINDADSLVVSADIPSGVDSETGVVAEVAVEADVTITFSAVKPGLLIGRGASCAGDIVIADLGIGEYVREIRGALELPGAAEVRDIIPWPAPADHKGSRGRVAIVAGSDTYPGAAVLAVGGALRIGAGYVYTVASRRVGDAVLARWPSAIVRPVEAGTGGVLASATDVLAATADADAVVVGPGITGAAGAREAVHALLDSFQGPLLLDADALNLLAGDVQRLSRRTAPTVITPHAGEAARLLGRTVDEVERDRMHSAQLLAGPSLVCVLKGSGTIVATAGRAALVRTGGPELARAGTGDVLAGMIGALLAQRCDAYDSAIAAVYLHGRAGALGSARLTATSLVASDVPGFIPDAVRELAGG